MRITLSQGDLLSFKKEIFTIITLVCTFICIIWLYSVFFDTEEFSLGEERGESRDLLLTTRKFDGPKTFRNLENSKWKSRREVYHTEITKPKATPQGHKTLYQKLLENRKRRINETNEDIELRTKLRSNNQGKTVNSNSNSNSRLNPSPPSNSKSNSNLNKVLASKTNLRVKSRLDQRLNSNPSLYTNSQNLSKNPSQNLPQASSPTSSQTSSQKLPQSSSPSSFQTLPQIQNSTLSLTSKPELNSTLSSIDLDKLNQLKANGKKKFVFFRILGNDLPPRHHPIQTQLNLKFILENEKEFPHCEKIWILNRIVDQSSEQTLINLLESYNKTYFRIPFVFEEYKRQPFNFTWGTSLDYIFNKTDAFPGLIDQIYHHKNMYVINNNGARNYALELGRELGKWILPFDGNLYFTEKNWRKLEAEIDHIENQNLDIRYLVVPMVRFDKYGIEMEELNKLNLTEKEIRSEEPQILFRFDATEEFDPKARYGRRPKIELLYRLGQWPLEPKLPWEIKFKVIEEIVNQVQKCQGWVLRLSSGNKTLEVDLGQRGSSRTQGIQSFLDSLERKIYETYFNPTLPLFYNIRILAKEKAAYYSKPTVQLKHVIDLLHLKAKEILETFDMVTFEREILMKPLKTPTRFNLSVSKFQSQIQQMMILTLASYFSIDNTTTSNPPPTAIEDIYSFKVIEQLDHWFSPNGTYNPIYLKDTQGIGNLLANADLHYFFDTIKILRLTNKISQDKYTQLQSWFRQYSIWFTSRMKLKSYRYDEVGTMLHLQSISLAGFTPSLRNLIWYSQYAKARIMAQISPQYQLTFPLENSIRNVNSLVNIATIASTLRINLWTWSNEKWRTSSRQFATQKLQATYEERRASADILGYMHYEATPYLKDHFSDLLIQVRALIKGIPISKSKYWRKQIFEPNISVRPFWSLGNV